jgi:PTH1 family peptidyl-tRNA hydrolase
VSKYLIAGLGNIGAKYHHTRHNIGFEVLDHLVDGSGTFFSSGRYADVAQMRVKNAQLVLIKPTTYMNLSGKAVNYWLQQEKIPLQNLLVVVDELALPLGALRLKAKGSDGGHNGLKHINQVLGRQDYARLRFGIGNDFPKGQQVNFVLGEWTAPEKKILEPRIQEASEAIKTFCLAGINVAMNKHNGQA